MGNNNNIIVYVSEFKKEVEKFSKKHHGFEKDMERFESALKVEWPRLLTGIVKISHIGEGYLPCYKAREFRCKALNRGSRSGIRIVFTYNPETCEFIFIELIFKGQDENHDYERLMRYALKKNVQADTDSSTSSSLTE